KPHGTPGFGTTANIVEGNYIGTEVTGTAALPNDTGVVIVQGANVNTIGGTTPAKRNLISGNTNDGVFLRDCNTFGNVIEGNYVGTKVTGAAALANGGN